MLKITTRDDDAYIIFFLNYVYLNKKDDDYCEIKLS